VYSSAIVHGLSPAKAFILTIVYDLLAFALQPLAGFLIDHLKKARSAMLIGIALTLTGVALMRVNALTAIVTVGIGNTLFHLGAGAQILGRYPSTASYTGIFVGPGALGLSIGLWFGSHGFFPLWYLVIGLIIACTGLAFLPALSPPRLLIQMQPHPQPLSSMAREGGEDLKCKLHFQPGVVLLLFAAIVVRGFVGRTGFAGLPSEAFVIIGLGAAACIGKMAGGGLADRFGWKRTTIIGLVLASIGIVHVPNHIGFAFAAMLFFQMTMPITLMATSVAIPGKPAFAFGLTCLALIIGIFPTFYTPPGLIQLPFNLVMIVVSGGCIIVALGKLGFLTSPLSHYNAVTSPPAHYNVVTSPPAPLQVGEGGGKDKEKEIAQNSEM
jgi:FSR family fosmidomycin resistance protein-like MFS transporter